MRTELHEWLTTRFKTTKVEIPTSEKFKEAIQSIPNSQAFIGDFHRNYDIVGSHNLPNGQKSLVFLTVEDGMLYAEMPTFFVEEFTANFQNEFFDTMGMIDQITNKEKLYQDFPVLEIEFITYAYRWYMDTAKPYKGNVPLETIEKLTNLY